MISWHFVKVCSSLAMVIVCILLSNCNDTHISIMQKHVSRSNNTDWMTQSPPFTRTILTCPSPPPYSDPHPSGRLHLLFDCPTVYDFICVCRARASISYQNSFIYMRYDVCAAPALNPSILWTQLTAYKWQWQADNTTEVHWAPRDACLAWAACVLWIIRWVNI